MKRLLLCGLLAAGFAQTASAVTLSFDDVPSGSVQGAYGTMSGGYQGFAFSTNLDWVDLVQSPWSFGARSGDFAILNNYSGEGIVTAIDGTDFSFDGLWAKAWDTGAESGGAAVVFGTLSGYKKGSLVWAVNTALNGSYQAFAAQAGQIDELHLGFGNHFLVDDLSLNGVTAVPEPTSYALMAVGLAVIAARARLRRTASA